MGHAHQLGVMVGVGGVHAVVHQPQTAREHHHRVVAVHGLQLGEGGQMLGLLAVLGGKN